LTLQLGAPNLTSMSEKTYKSKRNVTRQPTADEIIDRLGGTGRVADLFGVKCPSVSQWRVSGIPPARMHFIRHVRPEVLEPVNESEASDAESDKGNVEATSD
jgi:hypothetical protein